MADESSAELLERYRAGDSDAADMLFARYVERLAEVVRWHLAPSMQRRVDAEDAVHSAYRSFFIRARDGQFTLQNAGDLWRLLVTITLNKLRRQVAHHRAGRRDAGRDRPLLIDIARGPTPLEALAAADELETFMAKLPALQRRVLELRLQDHTWEEIAAATGRSERTVRRALEEVRRKWEESAAPLSSPPPGFAGGGQGGGRTLQPHGDRDLRVKAHPLALPSPRKAGGGEERHRPIRGHRSTTATSCSNNSSAPADRARSTAPGTKEPAASWP